MGNMYIEQFSEYLLLEKRYSELTVKAYLTDLEDFFKFTEETYQIKTPVEIEYPLIRQWVVSLSSQKTGNRSINRKTSALKSYFKFLQKIDVVENNPLAKHKSLKVEKKVVIPFSEKEIKEVFTLLKESCNDFKTYRNYIIVEIFYTTGIRRAELINLKVKDVDFSNRTLKVLGKRNKERYIPILDNTLQNLNIYLKYYKETYDYKEEAFLFLTNKGVKIYESFVFRLVNSYFSKVSVKIKKSPHVLRHSFATHLLSEGAELNAVKELLGHSSLAATQVYTNNEIDQLTKVYRNAHPRNR